MSFESIHAPHFAPTHDQFAPTTHEVFAEAPAPEPVSVPAPAAEKKAKVSRAPIRQVHIATAQGTVVVDELLVKRGKSDKSVYVPQVPKSMKEVEQLAALVGVQNFLTALYLHIIKPNGVDASLEVTENGVVTDTKYWPAFVDQFVPTRAANTNTTAKLTSRLTELLSHSLLQRLFSGEREFTQPENLELARLKLEIDSINKQLAEIAELGTKRAAERAAKASK